MKTKTGFDLKAILTDIFGKPFVKGFKDSLKSQSGGATNYIDPLHGEQSYQYSFGGGKLNISISTATLLCNCDHINTCFCDEKAESKFETWAKYWDATHEQISLTEKQCEAILQPSLFNQ